MLCRLTVPLCVGALVLAVGLPASSFAQDAPYQPAPQDISSDPPAHIAIVDGAAVLERDGKSDSSPSNMPLIAGDRVRTQAGRVEILYADGSALDLDTNTTVDFQSDDLLRLLEGRVRLSIPGPDRGVSYRIDAPAATAQISQAGDYRFAILGGEREPEVELAVLRGSAELVNDAGRTPLRAGEHAYSRPNAAPSYAYVFNSASWDAFDRWSETQRDQRLALSTQYLPDEVRPYASSFDRYGSWRYDTSYGYVWAPTVSVGWRPYYNGRWVTLQPYGWTWIGADPWAWPTHHYGRWGISAAGWFWIPGRTWGPAWVSWAYAPGYVSWCPLGWNNRPVVQIINVNAFGRGFDPWRAWIAVPQRQFGAGFNVRRIMATRLDDRTRGAFVARGSAPEIRGAVVPRAAAPIRVPGTAAGRRVNSPLYTNLQPGASRVGTAPSRTMVGPSRSTLADPSRTARGGVPAGQSRGVRSDEPNRVPAEGTRAVQRGQRPGIPVEGSRAVPRDQPGVTTYDARSSTGTYSAPAAGDPRSPRSGVAVPRPGRAVSSPGAYDPYSAGRRTQPPQPREIHGYDRAPADMYRGNYGAVDRTPPGMVRPPAASGVPVERSSPREVPGTRVDERPSGQGRPAEGPRAVPRGEAGQARPAPSQGRSGGDRRGGEHPSGSSRGSGRGGI